MDHNDKAIQILFASSIICFTVLKALICMEIGIEMVYFYARIYESIFSGQSSKHASFYS